MSEKVRIYQLAKDLGQETKAMLEILDEMGVEYKSHSSTLDGETADAVRQLVADAATAEEEVSESAPAEEQPQEAAPAEPADQPAADSPAQQPAAKSGRKKGRK